MEAAKKQTPDRDFGGVWTVLGDKQYKVPPLNFKKLREFQPKIEGMRAMVGRLPTSEEWDTIVEIIEAALRRNYPDIQRDTLEDILDVGNFREVFDAVLGASGVTRAQPGE